jgi:hypothetical protein
MTNSYDFYKVAEKIGQLLIVHGLGEWKTRIDDTIAVGSTGTEILMGLRWTFAQLQQSTTLPEEVKAHINEFNMQLAALGI